MEQEDVFDTPNQIGDEQSTISYVPRRFAKERATEHIMKLLEAERENGINPNNPENRILTDAEVEE